MANKRDLRKWLAFSTDYAISASLFVAETSNISEDEISTFVAELINIYKEYNSRINHMEPRAPRSAWTKLRTDFVDHVSESLKNFIDKYQK